MSSTDIGTDVNTNVKVVIKLPTLTANASHHNKKSHHSHKNNNVNRDNDKLILQFNKEAKVQTVFDVLSMAKQTKYLTNISLKNNGNILNEDQALNSLLTGKNDSVDISVEFKSYNEREVLKHIVVLRDFIGFISETDDSLSEFATSTGIKFNTLPLNEIKEKPKEVHEPKEGEEPKKNVFNISEDEKNNTGKVINEILEKFDNASIKDLLSTENNLITPCVRSINLSQYNPVPAFYKSKGHLLYLQVITLEGEHFHVTAIPSGFYINKSSNTKFDPAPKTFEDNSHLNEKVFFSLFDLLAVHSKKFASHVEALENKLNKIDSVAYVKPQTSYLHKPWLVSMNPNNVNCDYFRLQSETIESKLSTERNFNDEFQAIKDLPVDNLQNRMDMERLSAKLVHEFSVCATEGAMSILYNNIIPMNPEAPEFEQIYLKDNIFYSFVTDVSGTYEGKGGDEAARAASNQDILTISVLNRVGLKDVRYLLTTIVDFAGKRILAQTPVPGLLNTMGAEFVKDDITGNETLKDFESDIVVKYGLDEATKTIIQDKNFEELLSKEFAKVFHLKKNSEKDVIFSSQSKGIIGLDKRSYILDLANTHPLDINFVRENYDGISNESNRYPHRQTLLRPELIEKWWTSKIASVEGLTTKDAFEQTKFSYNPDAYQVEGVEDSTVDEISSYLNDIVIPNVIEDFAKGNVTPPYNGEHLTDSLHKNGINLRYLGKVASLAKAELQKQISSHESRLKEVAASNKEYEEWEYNYLMKLEKMIRERQEKINKYVQAGKEVPKELTEDLKLDDNEIRHPTEEEATLVGFDELLPIIKISEVEMISRSIKHVLRKYSRECPAIIVPSLVAFIFNLLFGSSYNPSPVAEEVNEFYPVKSCDFTKLNRESLLTTIQSEVQLRYRYELDMDSLVVHLENHNYLMREISNKFGIQWLNKNYYFTTEEFEEFKSAQDKKIKQKLVAPTATFSKDDFSIIPIVKSSIYSSIASEEYWAQGGLALAEGKQNDGLTFMAQSIAILESVHGIVHTAVAEKYTSMATIYSKLNLIPEAIAFCRKACIIYERTCGIDSFEMLRSLYNLALLELSNESPYNSVVVYNRIIETINGYNLHIFHHPTSTGVFNHLEQISLGVENGKLALEVLKKLSDFIVSIDGKENIAYAYVQSQLGNLYVTRKDYRAALEHISYAEQIFRNELGSNHKTTATSKQWINGLSTAMKDIQQKKQMNEEQANATGIPPAASHSKKSHSKKNHDSPNPEIANKSVDELLDFIEGDEPKKAKTSKNKKKQGKK